VTGAKRISRNINHLRVSGNRASFPKQQNPKIKKSVFCKQGLIIITDNAKEDSWALE